MRTALIISMMMSVGACLAQVNVDKPVVLNSVDLSERIVEGLAPAVGTTALIDLAGARSGRYHWGQAGGTAAAITLALQPPCAAYGNGLEVRFMPIANSYGPVTINVDGLGVRKIYRTDGLSAGIGELAPGNITTLVYADSAFFLMDRAREGCPPGYLAVNGQYCIQRNDTVNVSIFSASKWCSDRGARLCTWGEYIHACLVDQAAMEGTFNDWEWVDDTADHTHTAVQAGRWACRSERSLSATEDNNSYGRVRCCYTLR